MKRLATLIAALAMIVPATADGYVNRQVATKPDTGGQAQGYQRAFRFNPDANYQTWISACCYVPSLDKPWYSVGRPDTDLYAADAGAAHFWPGCRREWYGVVDNRSTTGFYYTFYHITC